MIMVLAFSQFIIHCLQTFSHICYPSFPRSSPGLGEKGGNNLFENKEIKT